MADRDELRNEELRQNAVEKMWLHYYNNVLLEQGLITESAYRQMKIIRTVDFLSAQERKKERL